MSDVFAYVLCGICVGLVFLPPKWDPAIRIKEWQIEQGFHPESRNPAIKATPIIEDGEK